jgi:hypothetical protein
MKKKIKQILCAILGHDNEVVYSREFVNESYYMGYKMFNKFNQVKYQCRRCGKTKCIWEE